MESNLPHTTLIFYSIITVLNGLNLRYLSYYCLAVYLAFIWTKLISMKQRMRLVQNIVHVTEASVTSWKWGLIQNKNVLERQCHLKIGKMRTSIMRQELHCHLNGTVCSPTFLMEAAPELPEPEYLQDDKQDWKWTQTALAAPWITSRWSNHKH